MIHDYIVIVTKIKQQQYAKLLRTSKPVDGFNWNFQFYLWNDDSLNEAENLNFEKSDSAPLIMDGLWKWHARNSFTGLDVVTVETIWYHLDG